LQIGDSGGSWIYREDAKVAEGREGRKEDSRFEIAEGFGFTAEAQRSRRGAKENRSSYFSPLRRGGHSLFLQKDSLDSLDSRFLFLLLGIPFFREEKNLKPRI
jgi:hypothetical protein